jgi:hypothetical protein
MKEIIHIVGLNNEYKSDFIHKLLNINPNYNIIDIDSITQIISSEKKYKKLYDDYDKIKHDKIKSKPIINDINSEWARELQLRLNKLLSANDKDSILIGLTTSVINNGVPKIYINLPTNYKFIIDIDMVENAKQIIKNNLKEYKNDIITGKFPLDYLNLDYLIKRREQLNQIYLKSLYISKKMDDILRFLRDHIPSLENNANGNPKKLYYVSDQELTKYITSKNIILYTDEVLAILSLFKLAELYYNSKDKTIKELSKNSLKELNNDCYIYEITDIKDVFFDGDNYKNNKKIKFNKSTYINCVQDTLTNFGVKFIKYSNGEKSKTEIK